MDWWEFLIVMQSVNRKTAESGPVLWFDWCVSNRTPSESKANGLLLFATPIFFVFVDLKIQIFFEATAGYADVL